jgi:hypothetical protein
MENDLRFTWSVCYTEVDCFVLGYMTYGGLGIRRDYMKYLLPCVIVLTFV